ncbi:MAG: hypothetical protein ISS88_00065 [Candidatus Portnoybacteria bacterium]|nr:hypothetical protein [Candidatus Portnoybacteria bacterium]
MDIKIMPEKYKRRKEVAVGFKVSAASFLNKLTSKTNLWLALTIGFLLLVILIYFGLTGYKNSLIKEKGNLEERLTELTNQRDLEMEVNFMELKTNIEDLRKVLENRVYSSKLFEMLEEITLPRVQFTGLEADLSQAKLILKAEAVDYLTLAKQVVVFEQDSRIEKVDLSEVNLETSGRIVSDLRVELNPDFLRSE